MKSILSNRAEMQLKYNHNKSQKPLKKHAIRLKK